jgi:hypothetical protein
MLFLLRDSVGVFLLFTFYFLLLLLLTSHSDFVFDIVFFLWGYVPIGFIAD